MRDVVRLAPYFLVFTLPALLLCFDLGGTWIVFPLFFAFGVIPTLDVVVGLDTRQPDEHTSNLRRWLADTPLLLWVPVQLSTTLYVLHRFATGEFSWFEIVVATISIGVLNGAIGITIAHELMHRRSGLHRAGAEILLASVHYTHFCIEHILGHHRNVATEHDPASSRYGESYYRFLPRVVIGSLLHAWKLERERCRKQGIPASSLRDRRTRYALTLLVADLAVLLAWGWEGLLLYLAQGVIAFCLLEAINYIEHYGLTRREIVDGRFERVQPWHSWNSAHRVSNWYLFNLARHSDHHYLASREYDRLRHHPDAPQLPTGYAGMVLLALVPPLWFLIMNPRVQRWDR
ncbi:MAG TPA: alkane 1-monooxygenase [Enhygromyxa sp.]|nr:alkane 1-monooxygenase [Enhygromyxa sp.]